MLTSDLPDCPHCRTPSRAFATGGSTTGPGRIDQGFECSGCGCQVALIGRVGGHLLAYLRGDEDALSEFDHYVNAKLIPTWKVRARAIKAHEKHEWSEWVSKVFRPAFPDIDYPNGETTYYDLPDEAKALVSGTFGGSMEPWRTGRYIPLPEELKQVIKPPQCPEQVHDGRWVFMVRDSDGKWEAVDPAGTGDAPVPRDPDHVWQEGFFGEVFYRVAEGIDRQGLPLARPIANGYSRSPYAPPWWTFELEGTQIKIGWRKRVVSIEADFGKPVKTEDIRELAERDKVTFSQRSTPRDLDIATDPSLSDPDRETLLSIYEDDVVKDYDRLPNDASEAKRVLIHAWNKDTAIEYLTQLCRMAVLAA